MNFNKTEFLATVEGDVQDFDIEDNLTTIK